MWQLPEATLNAVLYSPFDVMTFCLLRPFLLFLFVPAIVSECDINGTWATWQLTPNQSGYDPCGSYWQTNWIRYYLSEPDCPCMYA